MTVYASTARYKRRKAAGDKYLSIWFTPATLAVLRDLQRKGGTVENTIAGAILHAAMYSESRKTK
jgi:hypothetical protein